MKGRDFLLVVCCIVAGTWPLLIFQGSPLYAQQDDISQVVKKMGELEDRIRRLESALEIKSDCGPAASSLEAGWQNKKNWRQLRVGMTQSQVTSILGEPIKVIKGVKTLWYYPNIYCGYVTFDKEGNLTRWNEP